MTNDTQNSLTDFDMCLALAQKAINSQMKVAWETWIARSDLSTTGEMKNFALVSIYDNDLKTSGLEVEFDPLTVSLYVPSAKFGQVQVTLHLKSGTVFTEKSNLTHTEQRENDEAIEKMIAEAVSKGELSPDQKDTDETFARYESEYKKQNPDKYRDKQAITNWSISFLTDLDKKPCDLNLLEKIDPNAHKAASTFIQDFKQVPGLSDSVFSIEYLFMKFTEVDLLLSDNRQLNIPSDVPKAASDKAKSCLNALLHGNKDDFMLGTVVRRSKPPSEGETPTFTLTDFAFNVKADNSEPPIQDASTLSYLGMFSGRPLPAGKDLDLARVKLTDNWVKAERLDGTEGSVSGTMAISKSFFMNQYLIPKITEAVNDNFKNSFKKMADNPKEYLLSKVSPEHKELAQNDSTIANFLGVISSNITALDQANHSTTIEPQESGLTWTYTIPGLNIDFPWPGFFDAHKKIYSKATLTISIKAGTNQLQVSGKVEKQNEYIAWTWAPTTSTKIKAGVARLNQHEDIETSIELIDFQDSSKSKLKMALLGNESTWSQGLKTDVNEKKGIANIDLPNSILDAFEIIYDMINGLSGKLTNTLSEIKLDMNNSSFIPSGGGVFTFQNVRFSNAGDLLFDVIYKAP